MSNTTPDDRLDECAPADLPAGLPDALADESPATKAVWEHLVWYYICDDLPDRRRPSEIRRWNQMSRTAVDDALETLRERGFVERTPNPRSGRSWLFRARWPVCRGGDP